jgi:hypothetical protein
VDNSRERQGDGNARSGPLAPKIVAQVRELHETVVALSGNTSGFGSRQARRELKEARQSESDLLRVLGFQSYDEFVRVLAEGGELGEAANDSTGCDGEVVVVIDEAADGTATTRLDEARRTEVELRRVVDDMTKKADAAGSPSRARSSELDEFRERVGAFEEELAEVRFELLRMRDELIGMRERLSTIDSPLAAGSAAASATDSGADVHLAAGLDSRFGDLTRSLAQTVAELTALFGQVRQERADLAAAGQHAREEAERVVAAAVADANRTREDAAAEARRILDDARAQAIALTRDAIVTIEGLRRVHDADEPPRPPDAC